MCHVAKLCTAAAVPFPAPTQAEQSPCFINLCCLSFLSVPRHCRQQQEQTVKLKSHMVVSIPCRERGECACLIQAGYFANGSSLLLCLLFHTSGGTFSSSRLPILNSPWLLYCSWCLQKSVRNNETLLKSSLCLASPPLSHCFLEGTDLKVLEMLQVGELRNTSLLLSAFLSEQRGLGLTDTPRPALRSPRAKHRVHHFLPVS